MATPQTDLVKTPEPLAVYIRHPEVIERFKDVLGSDREALSFVQSVVILVQNSDPGDYSLQNCSNQSIVRSALRAVTLRVSVDPAIRQAWLVPRKNKKTNSLEACLQLHYAEVRNRAMRTGIYKHINVAPVYFGETVFENIYTGLHQVQLASGLMTQPMPVDYQNGWVPVGSRGEKVVGWLGYSERVRGGVKQTVYMSIADIEKHIRSINDWGLDTKAWKQNRQTMERKTVLLALLRKEDLGAPEMEKVKQVLHEVDDEISADQTHSDDAIDGQVEPLSDETESQATPDSRPYPPEVFKRKFREAAGRYVTATVSDQDRHILAAAIDGIFNGEKTMRYEVCEWLTGTSSTSQMSAPHVKTLLTVLGVKSFNEAPKPESIQEFRQAHRVALIEKGQTELPTGAQSENEAAFAGEDN